MFVCCSTRPATLSASAGTTADRSTRCRAGGHAIASGQLGARTDQGDRVGLFLFDPHPMLVPPHGQSALEDPRRGCTGAHGRGARDPRCPEPRGGACPGSSRAHPFRPRASFRDCLFGGRSRGAVGDPPPAGSSSARLPDDEPHRAELRGRTPAIEGDPALFVRAQTRSARVHYIAVIASEQVDRHLSVSGADHSIWPWFGPVSLRSWWTQEPAVLSAP